MQPNKHKPHGVDCIEHHHTRHGGGYAVVSYRKDEGGGGGRSMRLHRLVYSRAYGVPMADLEGKVVMHLCDNRACIHPFHLRLGSKGDNNRDRAEKGRSAKEVPSRQALTRAQCEVIKQRYTPTRCSVNGVSALARDYGVDTNVIYKVVRGTYVASK